ncbi:F-box protein SKIP23-like [Phoenix dactylifera]|uniref:F-box protein SKIP23-like n=1 Tax=Phoenix dactylifera TaxID=42345 RepID=A0A8B7BZ82_PHODC|nr:F-box protein SKIP23-like [Phoenix dactylifera]
MASVDARQSPWTNLPTDLMKLLIKKMTEPSDYIRFRCVCSAWRSAATRFGLPQHIPLLMLPYDAASEARHVFSLSTNKVHTVFVPELVNKIILTASHGWLVLLDVAAPDAALSLLNPVTRDRIQLPPTNDFYRLSDFVFSPDRNRFLSRRYGESRAKGLDKYSHVYPWQVVLSSNPFSIDGKCFVMIRDCYFNDRNAAVCKVGDDAWTVVESNLPEPPLSMACHNGHFYMIDMEGNVSVCKAEAPFESGRIHSLQMEPYGTFFFVAATRELLLFVQFEEETDDDRYEKGRFDVFKLRLRKPPASSWAKEVDGHALFRSEQLNQNLAVPAAEIPGCRVDCIYFSDPFDFSHERVENSIHEIDMLDVKTGNCEHLPCGWRKMPSRELLRSVWVQLSLF